MVNYFSDEEIEVLSQNQYVLKVSKSTITYTDEFRQLFLERYLSGEGPAKNTAQILNNCGFDLRMLGRARVKSTKRRIVKMSKREAGVIDTRKSKSGRQKVSGLTNEERIKYLEARNKYLEQENEFLKKQNI